MPEDRAESVLVLAPEGRDAELAGSLVGHLRSRRLASMAELCVALEPERIGAADAGAFAVVLAEEALDLGSIARLGEALLRQPEWSTVPLIVLADPGVGERDGPARLAIYGMPGAILLLERPIPSKVLDRALRTSLDVRRRQLRIRDLLRDREKALRDRDQFLAVLGHELRNPLNTIRNAIAIQSRIGDLGPAAERARAILEDQARLLNRLVDDLLDVSRVTSGKVALRDLPIDLSELARRCVEAAEPNARSAGVVVGLEAGERPVEVTGDPDRLEQVLNNLLTNAVKYTPSGGRVEVSVAAERDEAFVRVRDTGVGIPEAMIPKIFDLFTQVDGSIDRAQGGLGIGLTLVQSLVRMHGGDVHAESEGPGRGSVFTARLPLRPPAVTPDRPAAPSVEPALERSRRILVVDDNPLAAESLAELLRLSDHEVRVVYDGLAALAEAPGFLPEIVLLDIGLPGLDGYAVARKIRQTPSVKSALLIATTGYAQQEDRDRSRDAGFDLHLAKPIDLGILEAMIARTDARDRSFGHAS